MNGVTPWSCIKIGVHVTYAVDWCMWIQPADIAVSVIFLALCICRRPRRAHELNCELGNSLPQYILAFLRVKFDKGVYIYRPAN